MRKHIAMLTLLIITDDVVVETQAGSMRSGTQYSYLPGVGWGWHPYTYFATDYEIVYSSVTFSLSQNLEDLTLVGTGDINGTGNALANVIVGNAGVNVLSGGAGNDRYYVQTVGDDDLNGGAGVRFQRFKYEAANDMEGRMVA